MAKPTEPATERPTPISSNAPGATPASTYATLRPLPASTTSESSATPDGDSAATATTQHIVGRHRRIHRSVRLLRRVLFFGVVLGLLYLLLRFGAYRMPADYTTMAPGLAPSEMLMVDKAYAWFPGWAASLPPGAIIEFDDTDGTRRYARVWAHAGQSVSARFVDGRLTYHVAGVALAADQAPPANAIQAFRDLSATVPPDHVFILEESDPQTGTRDSRTFLWLPTDAIRARVLFGWGDDSPSAAAPAAP